MLQRYLGNKQTILPDIATAISECANDTDLVCDAFSGTLSVTLALKKAGYRVASNDINYFSHIYGQAFLIPSSLPTVDAESMIGKKHFQEYREVCIATATALKGNPGFRFLDKEKQFEAYTHILILARFLEKSTEPAIPSNYRGSHIFDTYSPIGKNSNFVSSRGTTGNRAFFSPSNAKQIDRALCFLRYWWREGMMELHTHSLLLSMLMDGIEKVSNTQGTYHDFPRRFVDQRSLRSLILGVPAMDDVLVPKKKHILGCEEDSLAFVKRLPPRCVLYLDPPYNFRQYSTYYFMPNVICKYHLIENLSEYFSGIEYVRGQNMKDCFDSPFCRRNAFIPALEQLIVTSRPRMVILSYFNGRNHWNDHSNSTGTLGLRTLEDFFRSSLFVKNSFRFKPIDRLNYQSYGGHKAKSIHELIITAEPKIL